MYRILFFVVFTFSVIIAKDPCRDFMTMGEDYSRMNDGIRHARFYATANSPLKEGFIGFSLLNNTPKISVGIHQDVHIKDASKENTEFIKAGTPVVLKLMDGEKIVISTNKDIYPKIKEHGLKKIWEIELDLSEDVFEILKNSPIKSAHFEALNISVTLNAFFKVGKHWRKLCECYSQEEFWD